ncbi:hypothetical protein HS041_35115 [Planomonospora sp. ID67723]|uniref:hypothetical protein n=1 Tax=Planomonospora sp. ID67723 TaxID=2738134 RepID=UPI0018C44B23|nr:hypothetical protein [Planomonospora sp. ID67723]MBG0832934.1 hypothetical protein [Planomonospora sp. ID67723]
MRLFRRHRDRRSGTPSGAPSEAPPRAIEDVDLDSLLGLVADSLGYTCSFAPDGRTLVLSGPREVTVRLAGLRAEAARRSREDWPMLVSEHLSHTLITADEPLDACDLAQVRPLLRTRVQRDDDLVSGHVVGRHLTADLVEVLTVGYGAAGRPVRPEEAGCWPITAAQALDLALDNACRDELLSVDAGDLDGVAILRLTGPTSSAAAHLRRLADYLPVPDDGVLVTLPDPRTLIVHPVEGIGVIRAIERLRLLAQREFDRGTDPLSSQVYWWHGGRLALIRADLVNQEGQTRLVVSPPPEFARVLAALAGRLGGGAPGS